MFGNSQMARTNVTYAITVRSIGGAPEVYDLTDIPLFDDDVIINNASYTSNAPGVPGGPLLGSGPWMLAVNQNIGVGEVHIYNLLVNVTIDIADGIGNDVYETCAEGAGLLNRAEIDVTDDGIADDTAEDCGDVECDINAEFEVFCDDNGTPSDPDDDVFFINVTVTGVNTSSTWTTITDPLGPQTGNYNEVTTLGPYSIADVGDFALLMQDSQDGGCLELLEVEAP